MSIKDEYLNVIENLFSGIIDEENDIETIVRYLACKNDVEKFITFPIEYSNEAETNLGNESPVEYYDNTLVINGTILQSRFDYDIDDYDEFCKYNTMILYKELSMAIEKVKMSVIRKCKANELSKVELEYLNANNDFIYYENLKKSKPLTSKYKTPSERYLECKSFFDTYVEFHGMFKNNSSVMSRFITKHESIILDGYDRQGDNICPLYRFFSQRDDVDGKDYLRSFDWYDKNPMRAVQSASLSVKGNLIDLVTCGMPIDMLDYQRLRNRRYFN